MRRRGIALLFASAAFLAAPRNVPADSHAAAAFHMNPAIAGSCVMPPAAASLMMPATDGLCAVAPTCASCTMHPAIAWGMDPSAIPALVLAQAAERETDGVTPKDMLMSALLPGLGELRVGARNRAIAHLAAETAIWVGFAVFRIQGGLRKDDYVEYAEVYAGVQHPEGQSSAYYRSLARYMRSDPGPDSYNEKEVRETARVLYPDDLSARQRYIDEHEIRGALAWSWESRERWLSYGDLRMSSEQSFQRARFAIAAAITNRIVSVLGLARTRGPGGTEMNVGARPLRGGVCLAPTFALRKTF